MINTMRTLSLLVLIGTSTNLTADEPAPDFGKLGRSFLDKHCIACHGGKKPKADLSLEPFRDSTSVVKQRKVWDNVRKMIAAGEMPPKESDRPRPTVAE